MKNAIILLLFLLPISCTANKKAKTAIRNMLSAQVVQWNKGNIEGYMKGYWENDSLLFIGKSGPSYGYRTTLERYKKSYPDVSYMGQLTSTIVSMQQLSHSYYFVVGKWYLKREKGDVSGSYTLLIHKVKNNWVIVSDHSS